MIVTVTSILLRSPMQFFTLSNHGRKIMMQAKRTQGFVRMRNRGWWRLHYTLSAWDNKEAMHAFARSGDHLEAMKQSAKLSTEIRTYTFSADHFPDWGTAKELLQHHGKVLTFPA